MPCSLSQLLSIFHPCLSSYFAPNTSLRVFHCLFLSLLMSPCFTPPGTFFQVLLVFSVCPSFCLSFSPSLFYLSLCLRQPFLFVCLLHSCVFLLLSLSLLVPHCLSLAAFPLFSIAVSLLHVFHTTTTLLSYSISLSSCLSPCISVSLFHSFMSALLSLSLRRTAAFLQDCVQSWGLIPSQTREASTEVPLHQSVYTAEAQDPIREQRFHDLLSGSQSRTVRAEVSYQPFYLSLGKETALVLEICSLSRQIDSLY